MSMLTSAAARVVNTFAAFPGLSGTPRRVIIDSLLSCATPEITGVSGPKSGNKSPIVERMSTFAILFAIFAALCLLPMRSVCCYACVFFNK